ncbi:MAG: hypothetical protein ACR2N4_02610 [Jatrophihabitans sp.]
MIAAVASCPHPPLLLPGITGRPVAEVELLRAACLAAVTDLLASTPQRVVIVGGVSRTDLDPGKPLSIVIGRLLLAEAGCAVPIEHLVVAEGAGTEQCLASGRELGLPPAGTALLVMADGSARRSVKAPGYLDERAAGFDAQVEAALAAGRPAGLAALDPLLAAELLVAGRAAWQVLAGATEGGRFEASLNYRDDPFGVWYPVATWLPRD